MNSIYKVTSTKVTTTKNGYKIFKLQLNHSIWASRLSPVSKKEKAYDRLYKIYTENNGVLDKLVGKYIAICLEESNYGTNFTIITSFDVIEDFIKLLEESEGEAFSTHISIYNFLKQKKYKINSDESITLKKPYDNFDVVNKNSVTVCYPNNLKENLITVNNIDLIYEKFYRNKKIKTGSRDRICEYLFKNVSIVEYCREYHKNKYKIISETKRNVLKIGDKLSEEQLKYITRHLKQGLT